MDPRRADLNLPGSTWKGMEDLEEILIIAIVFNIILLGISYFAATKAGVIISSLVWVLIGFALYDQYQDLLTLAITYMIAFAQIFIPLNKKVK